MFRPQQIQVPVQYTLQAAPSNRRDLPVLINPSVSVSRDLLGNALPDISTPLPDETPKPAVQLPYLDNLNVASPVKPAGPDMAPPNWPSQETTQVIPQPQPVSQALLPQAVEAQVNALYLAEAQRRDAAERRDVWVAGALGSCTLMVVVCLVVIIARRV